MGKDLSEIHNIIGDLFHSPRNAEDWEQYRLTETQVEFYQMHGYLAGIRLLTDEQLDALREPLDALMGDAHRGSDLFYEYHSNESQDGNTALFHALGA